MPELNHSTIEEIKKIMREKFPVMIKYFLEDGIKYIDKIKEGILSSDIEKIRSNAHTLKSSSKQIGADKVSELAKQIEMAAKDLLDKNEKNFVQIESLHKSIEESFKNVEVELREMI